MTEHGLYRYLIRFEKTTAMRFTGHLDLHRTLERTLRRAELPLAYSRGFTPHPRLRVAAALPLGCTGHAELAEMWLEQQIEPIQAISRLQQAAPPGLRVHGVSPLPAGLPALQNLVVAAEYEARLLDGPPLEDLSARVHALLAADQFPRQRRGKTYDLRPLIEELEIVPAGSQVHLRMRLAAREGASGRADEVLCALGCNPSLARIHRTALILRAPLP